MGWAIMFLVLIALVIILSISLINWKIEFSQLKFLSPLKTLVFPAFSPPRFGPFPSFFPL